MSIYLHRNQQPNRFQIENGIVDSKYNNYKRKTDV